MIRGRCIVCTHDEAHHGSRYVPSTNGAEPVCHACALSHVDAHHAFQAEPLPDKPRPWRVIAAPLVGFYVLDARGSLVTWEASESAARCCSGVCRPRRAWT